MTTRTHRYISIVCDGCGAVHGSPDQYQGAADARRGAFADGWTLVPKKRLNGSPARVQPATDQALATAGRTAHDVCGTCYPTFRSDTTVAYTRAGGKAWWTEKIERAEAEAADKIRQLEAEVARLRAKGGERTGVNV